MEPLPVNVDGLPDWDARALAAIACALLRAGHLSLGRRVLEITRRQNDERFDGERFMVFEVKGYRDFPPWALAIAAQADGDDIEGAKQNAEQRLNGFEQSLGLILVGEAQAEAGDKEGAWQTFQLAVAVSGEPEARMDTTSLSDIGLGAAQWSRAATAALIAERINDTWLTQKLEDALKNALQQAKYHAAHEAILKRSHKTPSSASNYFDRAWNAALKTWATWPWKLQQVLSEVIVAMAEAGLIEAAIKRYREAAEMPKATRYG